jgi:hypothetical protein
MFVSGMLGSSSQLDDQPGQRRQEDDGRPQWLAKDIVPIK